MAGNSPIIERVDIHKSCKALESVVNVFNDYCQAAESLALVQKRLARALKDAAGLKATNELAGGALSAAASLLESLAEVDARFVKVADKECEGASSELKKWFKKLAKEEKNHDDRISTANAKIKQAGQSYERKAKRKDRDTAEEHTRYVNVLSVVGPEMSQDKYNHALFVTQRHTSTLYSVAASISRTADAEWTRACECVRRFAPVVGRIGESRAYLEGGWTGSLPEINSQTEDKEDTDDKEAEHEPINSARVDEMGVRLAKAAVGSSEADPSVQRSTAPGHASPASVGTSSSQPSASVPRAPFNPPLVQSANRAHTMAPPPSSYFPATAEKLNTDSVRSIESLSSFPSPPTHFPLPNMTQLPLSPFTLTQSAEPTKRNDEDKESTTTEKPIHASVQPFEEAPVASIPMSESPKLTDTAIDHNTPALTDDSGRSSLSNQEELSTPSASPNLDLNHLSKKDTIKATVPVRARSPEQRRRRDSMPPPTNEHGFRDRKVSGTVERSESVTSTSSIVASMRDKLARGDVPRTSLTRERDIPRVPNKVSDLASRYTPATDSSGQAPLSPRSTGQNSPTDDRIRQVSGPHSFRDEMPSSPITRATQGSGPPAPNPAPTASEFDVARRRRRIEELEELERRENAHSLRAREREIELRAQELERERERLRVLGAASTSGAASAVRTHPHHSYSTTNLVAPRMHNADIPVRPVSQHGQPLALSASQSSSSSTSTPSSRPDHAPYCGCYTCSAAQYANPPMHVQTQAQGHPQKEKDKPKGWIRRLSMPVVGNAFSSSSSDSKKAYGSGAGITSGRSGYGAPVEGPPPLRFAQDGTGGISNVNNNSRPRKISFGRR